MKKYIYLFILVAACVQVSAQRLYMHDMLNGNYRSYTLGDKIEVVLLDSTEMLKGEIVGFTGNGFYLNDTSTFIRLNQVAAVVVQKRKNGFIRGLGYVAGGYLILAGVAYVIGGVVLIAEEPAAGAAVAIVGAAMGVGGYLIINKLTKNKNRIKMHTIDQTNYRLFIE